MKTAEKIKRPVLRYHGGKFLLADWIIGHFPKHTAYVEPFGGGASVMLCKLPSKSEVYNDIDGELGNLFRVLSNPAQARELQRLLYFTLYSRNEFESAYFGAADPIEAAKRLIVRSSMGIGNNRLTSAAGRKIGRPSTGFRSVLEPNGALRAEGWKVYVDQFDSFIDRFRGVLVENLPFAECIARYDRRDTLFYCDPPYPKSTRNKGDDYAYEMSDDDHRGLAECLRSVKGLVVLSGYACDLYDRELFPDWHRVEREAYADQAQKRTEVLWFNKAAQERMPQESLFSTLTA